MNIFDKLAIILAVLYFLPSIVAICRSTNVLAVILINIFLGWTFIGWIVALFLSLSSSSNKNIIITNNMQNIVGDNNDIKKNNETLKTSAGEDVDFEKYFLVVKNFCIKNKKIIIWILLITIGMFGLSAFFKTVIKIQKQEDFNCLISFYEKKSPVLAELYDCKSLVNVDGEGKYIRCRCLYEYSLKVADEYIEGRNKLLNKEYEYSHERTTALNDWQHLYYSKGLKICKKAM